MDYTAILTELNNASLFELHRLNVAIRQQLDDPERLRFLKMRLKTGLLISYFDTVENRLIEATIVELKRTKVLVEHKHDGELWNIPYYYINIDNSDTDVQPTPRQKINKSAIKVGDNVCFKDKKGNELFGEVIKLNPKTAGVLVGKTNWRVAYGLLSPIIDGELGSDQQFLEGKVSADK